MSLVVPASEIKIGDVIALAPSKQFVFVVDRDLNVDLNMCHLMLSYVPDSVPWSIKIPAHTQLIVKR